MTAADYLRDRYETLVREVERLDRSTPAEQRSELRRRIIDLYHEVDAAAARLLELRESVQELGERYRSSVASIVTIAASGSTDAAQPADGSALARADDLDVSTYLDRAWNRLASCRYEDALAEVNRALERVPGSEDAATLRGWALMRLDRLEEARQALESVLRLNSSAALARASLGYVALREGRFAEALEHLSLAARDATDRKAVLYAHLYLGMLYTRRALYRDGRGFLARALELGPSLVEAYWEMGRSYYLEGQFTQALETWRRGAEVNRFDPWGERCQEAVERAEAGAPLLLGWEADRAAPASSPGGGTDSARS